MTRPRSSLRRLLLFFCISLSILLLALCPTTVFRQPVASAHAFVIGSVPIDGSTVAPVPSVVRIFFDAPLSPASFANVYTPDERIVSAPHSTVTGNARELDTPLLNPSQLPQGSYTVRWTAVASDDGHTTHGVIGFNVGQSSAGLSGQTILGPSTSNILPSLDLIGVLAIAWEWLVLMALAFWIGILVIEGLVISGVERMSMLLIQIRKRSLPLQWLSLAALLVGECISLFLRASQLSQTATGGGIDPASFGHILTQSLYGYLWLTRIGLILCTMGLLWWTARRERTTTTISLKRGSRFSRMRRQVAQEQTPIRAEGNNPDQTSSIQHLPRQYTALWLLLAGLILLTYALTSHAAQLDQPHISAILLDWLYLTARCIWFGGLTYLGYVLLPLLPTIETDRYAEMLLTLLRRFAPVLLISVGVLLVSDFYLSESSIYDAHQLITDPYGRSLLVESVLVVLMLLLIGYVFLRLRPRLIRQAALLPVVNAELPARRTRQTALDATARSLKQSLMLQSWFGAGILLCAALMSFFAPPIVFPAVTYRMSVSTISPVNNPATVQSQTQKVGNLTVTLQLLPGRVDFANTVIVTMNDANGNPVTDAQVHLHINMEIMDMGTANATIKGGNPTYVATFAQDAAFSMFGRWDIQLTIQRPRQAPLQTTFAVTLQ